MAPNCDTIRRWPSKMARHPCRMCMVLSTVLYFIILAGLGAQKAFKFTLQPNDGIVMDTSPSNLFTFIQISDLHLNHFFPERSVKFREFATTVLDTVAPSFCLITGDLADSKDMSGIRGVSTESDWDLYSSILRSANRFNTSFVYDMRGNHDTFGQSSFTDSSNRYGRFAVQPSADASLRNGNKRVQVLNFTPPGGNNSNPLSLGTYRFVMYDTAPTFGPNLPINTFGLATRSILDQIETELKSPLPSSSSSFPRYQFFINHYPMSAQKQQTSSSGKKLQDMMQMPNTRIFAHIAGHFHSLNMYNRMFPDGSGLEIELADMRAKNYFRVFAVDNDMITTVDTSIGTWPLIVITNPKNAQFLSIHEPLHRIVQSSHIRVLVFSPSSAPVSTVSLSINGAQISANMTRSPSWTPAVPLYTVTWSPSSLSAGIHSMQVTASDITGRSQTTTQSFSVDGTTDKFPSSFGQMMQNMEISVAFNTLLCFMQIYFAVLLLGLPKYYVWKWRKEGKLDQIMAKASDFSNYYLVNGSSSSPVTPVVELAEIEPQQPQENQGGSAASENSVLEADAFDPSASPLPSDVALSVNQPVDALAMEHQQANPPSSVETPGELSIEPLEVAPVEESQEPSQQQQQQQQQPKPIHKQKEANICFVDGWNHFVASFCHQRDLNLLRFGLVDFKIWIVFSFMWMLMSFGPVLIGPLSGDLFVVVFSHGMVSEDGYYQALPDGILVTAAFEAIALFPLLNWFSYNSASWVQFTSSSSHFSSNKENSPSTFKKFRSLLHFYCGNYLFGFVFFLGGLIVINVLGVVCSSWPTIFISPICLPFTLWAAVAVSVELRRHQRRLKKLANNQPAIPLQVIVTPQQGEEQLEADRAE